MKKFAFAFLAIIVIVSLFLTGCGAVGPTEAQVAADLCLRGNQAACNFHTALVEFEKATENLSAAREAYNASIKTPTPGGK